MTCLYCNRPTPNKHWCPGAACKDAAHANRRKFGAALVAAGHITDAQIRAYLETCEIVSAIAADPEQSAPERACTAQETHIDARGLVQTHGEGRKWLTR